MRGDMAESLYGGFHQKKWGRQGKQAQDWPAGIVSGDWVCGPFLVVWDLALGDLGRGHSVPKSENLTEEVAGGMGSGLMSLHSKGSLLSCLLCPAIS